MARLLLIWLALASSAMAVAQDPVRVSDWTTLGPRRGEAAQTDPDFRRVIACAVRLEPNRSRNLINSIPGSNAADRIIYSFQSRLDQCFPRVVGGLGMSWNLLRGGIAEYLYHIAYPVGLPPAAPGQPSEAVLAWTRPRVADGDVPESESLHAIVRCVVLRNSAGISGLLANAPFSDGEAEAMRSIQGDLSACISAGVRFIASRQSLRGLLAEEALHFGEALARGFGTVPRVDPRTP